MLNPTFLSSVHNPSNEITNTSMPPVKGRWSIDDEKYPTFLKKYASAIDAKEKLYMIEPVQSC